MTVREALTEGMKALRYLQIPSADLDAEVLLAHALHGSREDILRRPERELPEEKLARYQKSILRRGKREPVAYITGHKEFFGRDFIVSRDVLVPRPESELLVDEALRLLPADRAIHIADIGTGSGCLAVTLAAELRHAHIVATDISKSSLKIAARNAARHDVASRIEFVYGDLLRPVERRRFDLLVANLPYVPETEVIANPDLMFEPIIALRGQLGPKKTLEEFLRQWYAREQRPAALIEIHPNQAERLMKENQKIGVRVAIRKDLAGRDRVAILRHVAPHEKKAGPVDAGAPMVQ